MNLDNLKSWYTFQEAAERLSKKLKSNIEISSIIDFVLSGHLQVFYRAAKDPSIFIATYEECTAGSFMRNDSRNEKTQVKITPFSGEIYPINTAESESLKQMLISGWSEQTPRENKTGLILDVFEGKKSELIEGTRHLESPPTYANFHNKADEVVFKRLHRPLHLPDISAFGFTKEELERFEGTIKSTSKTSTSGDTKGMNTLLRLLLGLALTNYEYNPGASRNSTATEISSDLALHGISVDRDTVHKWLEEAKKHLPKDWEPHL